MRNAEEIQHALNLFNLWVENGLLAYMETDEDAQLVMSNRELLQWVMGANSQSIKNNLQMFQDVLNDNNLIKLN